MTFGHTPRADVVPLDTVSTAAGLRIHVRTPGGEVVIESNLLGRTNVANILAALAAALGPRELPQPI